MLEENLRVTREVCATSSCIPNVLIESMLDIMSLYLPMSQIWGCWVESCCVTSLGLPISGYPRTDISDREAWSCHKVFREKEKFLCKILQEYLRGDYCNLPFILLKLFSQDTCIIIPLMGITSLYFVTALGRSSCSRLLRKPRSVHADRVAVKLVRKKYSSCNIE